MLGRASLGGGPDGQYFNAQKQDSDSKYRQGQLYGYPNSHHQPHRDSSGELEIGPALAVDQTTRTSTCKHPSYSNMRLQANFFSCI